jgi:hypothetical protein
VFQEVVKKIYDHLLVKVLSVTKDSLYAPKYNALHVLEHTELFDEAAHIIFFIRCMFVRVFQSVGVSTLRAPPSTFTPRSTLCAGTKCFTCPVCKMVSACGT